MIPALKNTNKQAKKWKKYPIWRQANTKGEPECLGVVGELRGVLSRQRKSKKFPRRETADS